MPRKYAGPLRKGERSAKVNKTYTKKYVKATPKALSDTKKLIKSIVLKTAETKYHTLELPKLELYHNNIYTMTNLMDGMPPQGDTDASREGDEIYSTGMRIRLIIGQKNDRPNVSFKIFVAKYNEAITGHPSYTNFFHSTSGNCMLDSVQKKRFKVIKAFTLKSKGTSMEVGESAKEYVRPFTFWVPLKKKLKFIKDDSIAVSNYNSHLRIIVASYDAYGTLSTDNIAYIQGHSTLYYKDV